MTFALPHLVLVGAILFGLGLYTALTRREPLRAWMGVELMLAAAHLSWLGFERFHPSPAMTGQVMALFGIALGAAEAIVAVAMAVSARRAVGARRGDLSRAPSSTLPAERHR